MKPQLLPNNILQLRLRYSSRKRQLLQPRMCGLFKREGERDQLELAEGCPHER